MKLRLCTIDFKKNTTVRINDAPRTKKKSTKLFVLELGNVESFGKLRWCGVMSEDITKNKNTVNMVRTNIDELEQGDPEARIEWFVKNVPHVRIIRIEADQIFDRLKNIGKKADPSVVIDGAGELKWNK